MGCVVFNRRLLVLQVLMFVETQLLQENECSNGFRQSVGLLLGQFIQCRFSLFVILQGSICVLVDILLVFEILVGRSTLYFCYLVESHRLS